MMPTIPGEIDVYGWSAYKIRIGGVVLDSVTSVDAKRTNNKTIGDCRIAVLDQYGEIYDSIDYLDEIEIYIQDTNNFYIANKVWGGWLDTRNYQQGNTHTLNITGKEYSNALFDKFYTHDYATVTDIGTISKNIVDDDGTLDSSTIGTTTGKYASLNFNKERHWDSLQRMLQPVGYEFGVNLNQQVYVRELLDAPLSADDVILGDNAILTSQAAIGTYVATDVTVQGQTSAISSNSVDSTSEDAYGRKRQLFEVIPQATDTTTTAEQTANILAAQSEQAKKYTLNTLFLPYTQPNDLLDVSIQGTELVTSYKVLEIAHSIAQNGKITSSVVLNHAGWDPNDLLRNLAKKYNTSEKRVWQ
jgi:hypothetical protein